MLTRRWLLTMAVSLGPAAFLAGAAEPAPSSDGATVRVTTFNIRLAVAKPKPPEQVWKDRAPLAVAAIKAADPDLLGMQEVLPEQLADLTAALPAYTVLSVGRNDGKKDGEAVPIFFKTDRFEQVDAGHFFLNESGKPGEKGWDGAHPRLAMWVRLNDRKSHKRLIYLNTHLDNAGAQARLEGAKLIQKRLAELVKKAEGAPPSVVMTGDFNSTPAQPPYKAITSTDGTPITLVDSFRETHPTPGEDERTFGGFKGDKKGANRIDWILHTPDTVASHATIDYFNVDGHYPSDHYPVHAVLRYK